MFGFICIPQAADKRRMFRMRNLFSHSRKKLLMVFLLALCMVPGSVFAEGDGTEPFYRAEDLFTARDLKQTADTSAAKAFVVTDGSDLRITEAGVYILTGTAADATVYVDVNDEEKVQLVLNGLTVTNRDFPCIYVLSADKVFITTAADSFLSVTGPFRRDGNINTDGVIFAKDDLVLNGTAVLTVSSAGNGVVGKDDLKITGGTYVIQASSKAFEANDSIRISGGVFTLTAGTDALQAENKKDESRGYVYISGGTFTIQAGDDGIHARSVLQIDGGLMDITAREGLEATVIQINGGVIGITSEGSGIHAAGKSSAYVPAVYMNGGEVSENTDGTEGR